MGAFGWELRTGWRITQTPFTTYLIMTANTLLEAFSFNLKTQWDRIIVDKVFVLLPCSRRPILMHMGHFSRIWIHVLCQVKIVACCWISLGLSSKCCLRLEIHCKSSIFPGDSEFKDLKSNHMLMISKTCSSFGSVSNSHKYYRISSRFPQ